MATPRFHFKSQSASVLIVVLAVCFGLVSLTLVFGHSVLMAYRGSDNAIAGREAEQAIEGAERYAEYVISKVDQPGTLPDPADYQCEAVPIGDATFWFIGEPSASDSVNTPAFGLVDEASKLNLNNATPDMLLALPGMTSELAEAIVNWRTPISSTASGATITSMDPIKHARFESVNELALLLSGTTLSLLYGEDANCNHVLDLNEDDGDKTAPADNSDGKLDCGLLEYVTVFSRESNTLTDGTTPRIDVTADSSPRLRTLLSGTLGNSRSTEILGRMGPPGTITSVLEFCDKCGVTEEEYAKFSADISGTAGAFVTGLINVNTATGTVLACVPGIGAEKASQIIAARALRTQPSTGFVWVAPILGPEGVKQAGKWLTSRSYQMSADIAAVGLHGRGYRRAQFIIDSSTGTPRIVYRRNLGSLGWALGRDARQMLAMRKDTQ